MIRQFFENLRRRRNEQRGRLPERHLDGPGIRPDQIATGAITPDKLASGPYDGPQAVHASPITVTGKTPPHGVAQPDAESGNQSR